MLCELKVDNLALIESLELRFGCDGPGSLVVMTGETGAGKSIMMRAIDLLSGGRGSTEWIRSGAENCTVEALFEIDARHGHIRDQLTAAGIDADSQVVCRRVIGSNGRSRFYVNGSLVTARFVSSICFHLLSIAGQHDHQQLLQPALHLDFLDLVGDHSEARQAFTARYHAWRDAEKQLAALLEQERERERRRDFLRYQVDEIDKVAPEPDEDARLGAERARLKNGARLIELSRRSSELLESSVIEHLAVIRKNMEQLREIDPDLSELTAELSDYSFLAEDYGARLRTYSEGIDDDPARLDAVDARLDELQKLKRKYGDTLAAVLSYRDEAAGELAGLDDLDEEIERRRGHAAALEDEVRARAVELSGARRRTGARFEQAMAAELAALSFDRAALEVRFAEAEDGDTALRPSGCDRVEFFFAPNPGEPSRPLAKVASGGELSRLLLAFKGLLAQKDRVETVIFDEVDAAIGGEAAESVARKIKELAAHHQVLCITHLPQIAARGNEHFRVEKALKRGRSVTSVARLDEEQRVAELARMLAGDAVTPQTEAWARELLAKGRKAA